jgi:hypothetical protein
VYLRLEFGAAFTPYEHIEGSSEAEIEEYFPSLRDLQ